MDDFLHNLYNMLPTKFQPYVVLALILAYIITKYRSNAKSSAIAANNRDVIKPSLFGSVVEFFF